MSNVAELRSISKSGSLDGANAQFAGPKIPHFFHTHSRFTLWGALTAVLVENVVGNMGWLIAAVAWVTALVVLKYAHTDWTQRARVSWAIVSQGSFFILYGEGWVAKVMEISSGKSIAASVVCLCVFVVLQTCAAVYCIEQVEWQETAFYYLVACSLPLLCVRATHDALLELFSVPHGSVMTVMGILGAYGMLHYGRILDKS